MIDKKVVKALLDEKIEETGEKFFVVDLTIGGDNKIAIEIDHEERSVSIDDCVMFSRQVEHNLDREKEDFELEVASAGLSNPLKVHKQYVKNIGRTVKLLLQDSKTVEGELVDVKEDESVFIKYMKKEKKEGEKKTTKVEVTEEYKLKEINQTKIVITFK